MPRKRKEEVETIETVTVPTGGSGGKGPKTPDPITVETQSTEVATANDTESVASTLAAMGMDGMSGLEEVSSVDDVKMSYLRLLQNEDDAIDGSAGGMLVDTVDNSLKDIRKEKGAPITVVPLMVLKDFEAYQAVLDSKGDPHATEFGDKLGVYKEHEPLVQKALGDGKREGTRNSYVVYKEDGGIDCLIQEVIRVYIFFDDDLYCLSLRGSKIFGFFQQWNKIMRRKMSKDSLPICAHAYELSSKKETNSQANASYWNFEINYKGLVEAENLKQIANTAKTITSNKGKLNVEGSDKE